MNPRILLRADRPNVNGSCPFSICVNIGNRKVVLGLGGISAKPSEVDKHGFMRGRSQAACDMNMILRRELARADEILIRARLIGVALDAEGFKAEWAADGGSQDFIAWSEKELARQVRLRLIGLRTQKKCATTLKRLKQFAPEGLRFSKISQSFLEEFDAWHRNLVEKDHRSLNDGRAGRAKALRVIRKFVLAAKRAGIYKGASPFGNFRIPADRRSIVFLTMAELSAIRAHHDEGGHAEELRPFLFACYTGLRFSDVAGLEDAHIVDGKICKVATKGRALNPRQLEIPMSSHARRMMASGGLPLVRHTDQHINRTLKAVATELGIRKRVTFHVSRHTFATLFLEAGGAVEVLQQLLGHASLRMTMDYVHVAGERKATQMGLLEKMLGD